MTDVNAPSIVSGYEIPDGCCDELLAPDGTPLPHAAPLMAALDRLGPEAQVDTHAWLEALLPTPDGGEPVWVGADPTNRVLAGETHVKIGHGRHYADVPPIKGVYRGAASAKLDASVTMTRLEGTDPAAIARA